MNKKRWITLICAVLLLSAFCISSAFASSVSNSISFAGKVKVYKLIYNANGGGGTAPVDADRYTKTGTAIVMGQGALTPPTGKTFAGWSTVSDAVTPNFLPGSKITFNGNDITLYAIWTTDVPVTVTYHFSTDNYVTQKTHKEEYVKGQIVALPPLSSLGWEDAAKAANLGFDHWTDSAGTLSKKVLDEVTVTEDTDFYAILASNGTVEFTAHVYWDDAGNVDGVRPFPSDVAAGLKVLDVATGLDHSNDTDVKAIVFGSDSDAWTITWANLPGNLEYKLGPVSAEGYSIVATGTDTVTYHHSASQVIMRKWITNKKWDKYGNLIKFKAGQTVIFRMDIVNIGNTAVDHVQVYETLKGVKFKKKDGYKITSDGYAYIGTINPGQTVSVYATYVVKNSDTRKDKVANVAGVDYRRADGTWGADWDAVRIPINRNSSTTYATVTATPSPTPAPTGEYMIERLLKDINNIRIAYPSTTFEIVGAQEILTSDEYAVYQTLTTQDKLLTVLNTVGFDSLVSLDRLRLNLTVSETAQNLMNTILTRKQAMTAEQKTEQQAKENIYFPKQTLTVNGLLQNYFEISLKVNSTGRDRIDRYTFRQNSVGEWEYIRLVSEQ